MKQLFAYFGGKQLMLRHILPLIPTHSSYVEPFIGGGTVFFAKRPVRLNIINDADKNVSVFYQALRESPYELAKELDKLLWSKKTFDDARRLLHTNYGSVLERAVATFVMSTLSFGKKRSCWGYCVNPDNSSLSMVMFNRVDYFKEHIEDYVTLLRNTHVDCNDALHVIQRYDHVEAFMYLDPPYVGTDCSGYFSGSCKYGEEEFRALLEVLSGLKGKFLLSMLPNDLLEEYIVKCGWKVASFGGRWNIGAKNYDSHKERAKGKTELLVANYDIVDKLDGSFDGESKWLRMGGSGWEKGSSVGREVEGNDMEGIAVV